MTDEPGPHAIQSWLPQRELAALHRSLASAQDAQITRLVAMVDRLRHRGVVDDLVAPFRSRLAQLRPARPLRFVRLLFTPLDPLIVPAPRWRAEAASLPRTSLPMLAAAAHATMGAEAARIESAIAGHCTRDATVIAQAGAVLWPGAAQALLHSDVPAEWTARTGLPAALFPLLAGNAAAVLEQALPLQALRAEAEIGIALRPADLTAMLRRVHAMRPQALGLLIALVLARIPDAARLLAEAAAPLGRAAGVAVQMAGAQARASLLEQLQAEGATEARVFGADLAQAGGEVRRLQELLQGMAREAGSRGAVLAQIHRRLEISCRTRFTTGLETEFLHELEQLAERPDDAAMIQLEEAARGLRELGTAGRRFGSPGPYDGLLRQTVAAVKAIAPNSAVSLADKVRLVEILAGPEEAWALLQDEPA